MVRSMAYPQKRQKSIPTRENLTPSVTTGGAANRTRAGTVLSLLMRPQRLEPCQKTLRLAAKRDNFLRRHTTIPAVRNRFSKISSRSNLPRPHHRYIGKRAICSWYNEFMANILIVFKPEIRPGVTVKHRERRKEPIVAGIAAFSNTDSQLQRNGEHVDAKQVGWLVDATGS